MRFRVGVIRLAAVPLLAASPAPLLALDVPPIALASAYRGDEELTAYWVSEKLDGMRGYWDGTRLLSRNGNTISAPAWFTRGWPDVPLDGELWIGRGAFEATVSTVRRTIPDDVAWKRVRFMVFDLPAGEGTFRHRFNELSRLVDDAANPALAAVEQRSFADREALMGMLRSVVRQGGEGLILRRIDAPYRSGRGTDLLKLKTQQDSDARVVGYVPGKGRHAGALGALIVESADGKRFRLGSGLTDEQRASPPAVGTWVSYRFRGEHRVSGLPRFPSFLRARPDLSE